MSASKDPGEPRERERSETMLETRNADVTRDEVAGVGGEKILGTELGS